MPMDRKRYPTNWNAIALSIKRDTEWHCEQCGKPCRRPGESLEELAERLPEGWREQLMGEVWDEESGEHAEVPLYPQKFCLTLAHLNHIPEDCRPENLKALCSPCHCRYDLRQMPLKKQLKREHLGQLNLFGNNIKN